MGKESRVQLWVGVPRSDRLNKLFPLVVVYNTAIENGKGIILWDLKVANFISYVRPPAAQVGKCGRTPLLLPFYFKRRIEMLGKPKYVDGDIVKFKVLTDYETQRIEELIGSIYIVDAWGTFQDNSDVSYDILVKDYFSPGANCLFKHISEFMIDGIVK